MDKLTVYRGILFGLRQLRGDFPAHGSDFHRAFGLTMKKAEQMGISIPLNHDPVFDVYDEATEMLMEGEQDLLLSLMNPTFHRATFKISQQEAEEQLRLLPDAEKFRELGKHFDEALR